MLAEATRWLVAQSSRSLIVARNASRFPASAGSFAALDTDWKSAAFQTDLQQAVGNMPPISRGLLWLHEPERYLPIILDMVGSARLVLVLGSMDGCPEGITTDGNIATVKLGSMPTEQGRRWLTHSEISEAAIAALKDGNSRTVGELQPLG